MEDLLRRYVTDRKIEIPALKLSLESTQPDQLLRLLLTIKNDPYSAVMIAAEVGHTEACHLFLAPLKATADELLWMKETHGCTALHIALEKGESQCVEILLDTVSFGRKHEFVAEKNNFGATALTWAALWGREKSVELFCNNFCKHHRDSLLMIQDNNLSTALHYAAYRGETTALKVMLESVSLLTVFSLLAIKNRDGCTPLESAECTEKKEAADLLLRWQNQAVVEVLVVADEKISSLQIADKLKTQALTEAHQKLSSLQEQAEAQEEALNGARKQIITLQEQNERKLSALQKESRQKLLTLQEYTEQQAKGDPS
ncbi:CARD- and ANK-domain containing inflammasome adapter protein-like [Watersipora subatra]|uniref:CARD- and ANK-domain containing inflammasome adapter protein-like n=1 Tax=Watersipora subatra TaxID=2589382 RepID=UPI00355AE315